ncbi:hypothetical protein HYC85_010704 [Camellia sinensis]|uniref:Uncharacterized protein n=1 Tax=Camellia sinensis TaxID=4442 RepID=A0A7J7HIM6_CAMSI|nr:hypothetical protein HYC85_010704 [Camellia sinensis]
MPMYQPCSRRRDSGGLVLDLEAAVKDGILGGRATAGEKLDLKKMIEANIHLPYFYGANARSCDSLHRVDLREIQLHLPHNDARSLGRFSDSKQDSSPSNP